VSGALGRGRIGAALCACLLAIGIVVWPDSKRGSAELAIDAAVSRSDSTAGRRSISNLSADIASSESRLPASSDLECDVDESESPLATSITLRGRVVFADGSPASGARVWKSSARTFSSADGSFELAVASDDGHCRAALAGLQCALEQEPRSDPILLRLGPPTSTITGRIRAEHGLERQGWRIAVLDATLIEPVELAAATLEKAASRSSSRAQCSADGSFAIDGLSQRAYTLAAWRSARERIELFAAPPALPGTGEVEIQIPSSASGRTVEPRCVDSKGAPLSGVRVGFPGTPAIATTDARGKIVIVGAPPARLKLVVTTLDGSVLVKVLDLSDPADIVLD